MTALGTVIEPELHRDLVTLKMVHDLSITPEGVAQFTITLTTPEQSRLAGSSPHKLGVAWDN